MTVNDTATDHSDEAVDQKRPWSCWDIDQELGGLNYTHPSR